MYWFESAMGPSFCCNFISSLRPSLILWQDETSLFPPESDADDVSARGWMAGNKGQMDSRGFKPVLAGYCLCYLPLLQVGI